ncbi:glycoside hydrolase family 88/105 protein [Chryseosolibacter histidini]|nr:glycoside hydrolase family 88 protein [Chryseosolibacter histidini]
MNATKKLIASALLLLAVVWQTVAQTPAATVTTNAPWSVRMADSDIIRNPKAWMIDFVKDPKWNYTPGLVCSAMERLWKKTGDEKYYQYIKTFADEMINEDGTIKTYKPEEYNIDKVNSGKFLFALYAHTGDEKYARAIKLMRDQMRTHPRTSEGGFWHKKMYPHQMWLDGIYMGSPFLAQYARVFNEPALFDDVAQQIRLIEKHTYDAKLGLYYHAWDESKQQQWASKETGKSPHVWGRAMGWYAMALVDILDFFPKDHPARKEILQSVDRVAKAIIRYQDKESGLWYQVVDQGKREGNYLEGSASSMYTYFLLKAVKEGYIDRKYLAQGEKAYKGIIDRLIKVDNNGMVSITQVCAVAGLGGDPYRDGTYEYYINEKKRDNDPKAVGPFIMASLLFEALGKNKETKQ